MSAGDDGGCEDGGDGEGKGEDGCVCQFKEREGDRGMYRVSAVRAAIA